MNSQVNEPFLKQRNSMEKGAKITFPYISLIRRACMTEFLLDECVIALKARIEELENRLNLVTSPQSKRYVKQSSLQTRKHSAQEGFTTPICSSVREKQVRFSLDAIPENSKTNSPPPYLQRQDSTLTDQLSLQSKLQAR